MDFWDAAEFTAGSVVSVIGAGGKTTSVFTLAEQASQRGLATLVTTTTKMRRPELPLFMSDDAQVLDAALEKGFVQHRLLAAGSGISSADKLLSLRPGLVCSLQAPDVILCEADGAAGRSLKIHRPGEPVVPDCTSHLIVVAGLDAMGVPLSQAAHPSALSALYLGSGEHQLIQERHVEEALVEGAGYMPARARLVVVLNKADDATRIESGRRIAAAVLARRSTAVVLLTERGQVIEEMRVSHDRPTYTQP